MAVYFVPPSQQLSGRGGILSGKNGADHMPEIKVISNDPNVGQCSQCKEILEIPLEPLFNVRQRLNASFEKHVREKHPDARDETKQD